MLMRSKTRFCGRCRTLLDMKETQKDWWQFFKEHLHASVAGQGLQLAVLKDNP